MYLKKFINGRKPRGLGANRRKDCVVQRFIINLSKFVHRFEAFRDTIKLKRIQIFDRFRY